MGAKIHMGRPVVSDGRANESRVLMVGDPSGRLTLGAASDASGMGSTTTRRLPIREGVLARLRKEQGFGMVELLVSMVILNVALLALVAAYSSGNFALRRAGRVATASTLANSQMELYRALLYSGIALDSARVTSVTSSDNEYSCDSAIKIDTAQACGTSNRKPQVTTTSCASPLPSECEPSRSVRGPDNHLYRVDTYIITDTPPTGRPVKRVTVVIRDAQNLSKPALQRVASVFDESTGL